MTKLTVILFFLHWGILLSPCDSFSWYWGAYLDKFLPPPSPRCLLQQPEEDEDGEEVAQDGGVTQTPSVAAETRAVEGRSSSEDDKNSDSTSSPTSPGEFLYMYGLYFWAIHAACQFRSPQSLSWSEESFNKIHQRSSHFECELTERLVFLWFFFLSLNSARDWF